MTRISWKIFVLVFGISIAAWRPVFASRFVGFDPGQKGIGFLFGQPLDLRFEYWTQWKRALYFNGGYHTDKIALLGVDYALYSYDVMDHWRDSGLVNSLLFYYGPGIFGGKVLESSDPNDQMRLGGRLFGGFQYMFGGGQFSLRLEVGPSFHIFGDRFIQLWGGVGLAYYFGPSSFKRDAPVPVRPEETLRPVDFEVKKKSGDDDGFDLSDEDRKSVEKRSKTKGPIKAPSKKAKPAGKAPADKSSGASDDDF